jgi:hypothetical protein
VARVNIAAINNTTNGTIEFRSTISPIVRLLLLVGALIPLIAPYELVLRPRWESPLVIFGVFAILASIGAVAVSVILAAVAIFGLNEEVTVDPERGVIRYACKRALLPARTCEFPIHALTGVAMTTETIADGPTCHKVVIGISGHGEIESPPIDDRAVAEQYRYRLEELMRRKPAPAP